MKGVVFLGDRKLELREFPDPTPGPRDVVLEIKASGMCGSDLHNYRGPPPSGEAAAASADGAPLSAGGASWAHAGTAQRLTSKRQGASRNFIEPSSM